jgi:hypothetical protein
MEHEAGREGRRGIGGENGRQGEGVLRSELGWVSATSGEERVGESWT